MKKTICLITLSLVVCSLFGQGNETPFAMYEIGSGYSIGINRDNSVPLEIRMVIPFGNFGIMVSGGADFVKENGGHAFLGVSYFVFNTKSMRVPVSLGFGISGNQKHFYMGFSGMASYHYMFTKNIYAAFTVEVNYSFNDRYNDIVGNGAGSPANGVVYPITILPAPKTEETNHFGSYVYIKPTICIGYQF